jgi:hypothetical protein
MAKILIDGRFIGIGESIARYTLETLSRVLEIDKENHYTLLVCEQGFEPALQFFLEKEYVANKFPISNFQFPNKSQISKPKFSNLYLQVFGAKHYSIEEQTGLLRYLNHKKYDLVHFTQFNHPIFYRGKFISTIHDLTMIGHLHRQKFWRRWACLLTMRSAIKNSQKVFAVSNFTKQDLVDWYGIES